ncbi:uncharacterized protein LOC111266745 [Varroa jacobsoni]|uniref:uncharacterized protein LOC111266745 n=1 Tax=Varroa jacobsoni TaxID=62625 RepID=UPI000BF3025D|nr:uncharacterized protein LOC111266745 [Varroa jacobsoni]
MELRVLLYHIVFITFCTEAVVAERGNYCPRSCIRGVQQFPFSEICICPEYCPLFCCAGYYYHSPVHGICPITCGSKSRPIYTECCLPGGFTDPACIIAQKRWFDRNTRGVWWWPAVFNHTSSGYGKHSGVRRIHDNQLGDSIGREPFTTLALVKPGKNENSSKLLVSNTVNEEANKKVK